MHHRFVLSFFNMNSVGAADSDLELALFRALLVRLIVFSLLSLLLDLLSVLAAATYILLLLFALSFHPRSPLPQSGYPHHAHLPKLRAERHR